MSLLHLSILAVVAMIGLAALRSTRAHLGRTPLPEGKRRVLFILVFLIVPPIAVGMLTDPGAAVGIASVVYLALIGAIAILMWIAAELVRLTLTGRSRRLLLIALVGSEGDPDEAAVDPAVTAKLAACLAIVDRANAVFPRGPAFRDQADRVGFRPAWDALDAATGTLERRIADDRRLGLGVASAATATAVDARSRLDALRDLALSQGQAWAAI